MKTTDHYATAGDENEYEPGSNGVVLKNLCGITTIAGMEKAETMALVQSTEEMLDRFDQHHRFTAQDICSMHQAWLGGIYSWAGNYRQVMMSKDGFPFAAPAYIPALMGTFEKEILSHHTPCRANPAQCAESLAIVHVELVLIHPFFAKETDVWHACWQRSWDCRRVCRYFYLMRWRQKVVKPISRQFEPVWRGIITRCRQYFRRLLSRTGLMFRNSGYMLDLFQLMGFNPYSFYG